MVKAINHPNDQTQKLLQNKSFANILFAAKIPGLPRFARNDGCGINTLSVIARPRSGRGNPGDLDKNLATHIKSLLLRGDGACNDGAHNAL
ncbi:MAG: hypothetical protein WCG04_03110 [Alphaproteobacteria bacterium]